MGTAPAPSSTRERLIQAAVALFWEKGYANTSMSDLLAHAGVNSGSFYHFFNSKEELLLAMLDRYLAMLHPMLLDPAWEGVNDPIERVFALLSRYRELIVQTECTYGCPIGRLALEISPEQRDVHKLLARNFDGWSAAVRDCLDAAADRIPLDVDRDRLSKFVLTVMEGGVMLSRSHRSVAPFDDAVAELRAYFNRLLADAPRSKTKKKQRRGS
ncbi:MAG TPA: TetR/AcrR family transcriptional regulator [Bryobacteraceae bacterium]|nr:TetR/AcrR family transcriptional regulator [Bryobacteraceae bacterium]